MIGVNVWYVEHVNPYTRGGGDCGSLKNDSLKQYYFINQSLETF